MKKRVLTWLLPMLLLCLLPVAAWAAGDVAEVTAPDGAVKKYADVDDAVAAWKDNGGTLKLLQDCKANEMMLVKANNAVLDLNGHSLARDAQFANSAEGTTADKLYYQPLIKVVGNGALTIDDTSANKNGGIVKDDAADADKYKYMIMVNGLDAGLTLKNGVVECGDNGAIDVEGTFTMLGGTIKIPDGFDTGVYALNGAKHLAVSGGTFEGSGTSLNVRALKPTTVVDITGGTFSTQGLKVEGNGLDLTIGAAGGSADTLTIPQLKVSSSRFEGFKLLSGTITKVSGSYWAATEVSDRVVFKDQSMATHLPGALTLVASNGEYKVAPLSDTEIAAYIVNASGNQVAYSHAVAAAASLKNNETLVLKKDPQERMNVYAVNCVVDLDGKTITSPNGSSNGAIHFVASEAGTVTVKNGTIANTAKGKKGINVENKGGALVQFIPENLRFDLHPDAVNLVNLSTNAYMAYTPENDALIRQGGFVFDGKLFGHVTTAQKLANGQEILLAKDYTGSASIQNYIDGPVVLNLNGHTYTYTGKSGGAVYLNKANQVVTVKNGTIVAEKAAGALLMSNDQSLTLDNVKLNSKASYGVSGNGNNENNTITLQNGTVVTTTAEDYPGIYFPCSGTLTIDNAEVHGMGNGVQMCAGNLVVRGDKTRITASGADTSASKTGDGPISDGAAISVVNREGYKGIGTITIEGGQFESEKTEAVNAFTWDAANKNQEAWDNTDKAVQVQGGQFSTAVDEALLDERLTVELKAPGKNPDAPYSYHPSVEDAMSQAEGDGSEIKDLTNPAPETGSVTVTLNSGCTELANVTMTVAKGGFLTLPTPSRDGHRFDGWEAENGQVYAGGSSLKVESNMVLTASWSKVNTPVGPSNPSYQINTPSVDNGSVTVSPDKAQKGDLVTITVTPDAGYVVDVVAAVDKNGQALPLTDKGNGTYTFTMPASKVDVVVTFKPGNQVPSALPFTDVHESDWFYGPVVYAYEHGIMNGTGDGTTFSPNVPLNRAMMAAVLYNLEGGPAVKNDGAFSDVPSGQWYTDAVNWAAGEGIVGGIGDGLYAPNANLTREQMASVLYRYAEYKGIDVSKRADLATFVDGNTVSPWATEVVEWAVAEKLINGTAGNTLQPQGTATRAQVATVLMNFCENVAK